MTTKSGYKPMNPELKAQWLAALRSGKYRKTTGRLARVQNKRYSYCCLGVLCNLDTRAERLIDEIGYDDVYPNATDVYFKVGNSSGSAFLPTVIQESASLTEDVQKQLAQMNDGGKSFRQIADWIEENL